MFLHSIFQTSPLHFFLFLRVSGVVVELTRGSEVLQLLGATAHAAVYKAAYPKDDTPVDEQAPIAITYFGSSICS